MKKLLLPQLNIFGKTQAEIKNIKAQKRRRAGVLQAFATQSFFIYVKYLWQDLVGRAILSFLAAAAILVSFTMPVSADENESRLPAFPGAEGGGKYTTGARGGDSIEVFHVTNLNADGEGSFKDAVSKPDRIIVFDVSGIITIPEKLRIEQPNLTILGQTAPGGGVTFTGADLGLYADNIIMRYIKVRPTDLNGGEPDGIGGRWIDNIIIDHCSVSWGVDELITLYAGSREQEGKEPNKNTTVQYCIASEALRMSSHIKGAHGYGGITGGELSSFHHNLMAHNDSRNPRLDRNLLSTDVTNNVIYNWGINTIYGGEPYSYNKQEEFSRPEFISRINIRDNYFKYGPNTRDNVDHVRSRVFEATNDGQVTYNGEVLKSEAYIEHNFVYGDEATTANNWNHNDTVKNQENLVRLSEPADMGEYAIKPESAEETYNELAGEYSTVGAWLPMRDSIDARVINDVKNGTGRVINQEEEVGGLSGITSETRVFEIPADWKAEHNMGDAKESDIVQEGGFKGYTWIEAYVNDWELMHDVPTNPEIRLISPVTASYDTMIDRTAGRGSWLVTTVNDDINIEAQGDESVIRTELYDAVEKLKDYSGSSVNDSIRLAAGTHYLFVRAFNEKGEATDSDTAIVYVNGTGLSGGIFAAEQIGSPAFDGKGGAWYDAPADTYHISGSGLIGGESDSCDFAYGLVTGDFAVTAKIESIPKFDNGALAGIMARESLDGSSDMLMLGDGWLKGGENISVDRRIGGKDERIFMPLEDGTEANNSSNKYPMPSYMRMERKGDKLIVSVSNTGTDWTDNDRKPMETDISGWSDTLYLGLAVDSNDGLPMVPYYSQAAFSGYKVEGGETPVKIISLMYDDDGKLMGVSSGENESAASVYMIYKTKGIIRKLK